MKTSLKKLRGFALHRHDKRERHHHQQQQSLPQLDELSQASQDMQDMRDCYDSLLSAAAATANSAFEFSESLKEMGDCLLEKTALNEDEESGKVLLMLGKVQFELQKLVDSYRSHIFQTITVPSESLLNELRIVEEMKRQCDEKRSGYEDMITRYREKGRLRGGSKGECFSSHQLQAARDDYDEEANLFVFRMKSLKRGQSRSLLTQAARHHAAQLCFFKKGLKSLETIEPHVKLVTEQQHIDYPFNGLEDDVADDSENDDDDDDSDEGNVDNGYEAHDDGELSFDYRLTDQGQDRSASRDSMELDTVELTFPRVAKTDALKENLDRNHGGNSLGFSRDLNQTSSKSAPLFAEKNSESTERFRHSSTRRLHAYVLPTPAERRHTVFAGSATTDLGGAQTRAGLSGGSSDLWHSSPLDHKRYEKLGNEMLSGPIRSTPSSVLRESNINNTFTHLPPPLHEGFSSPLLRPASDTKKIKRQAFSGPLTGNSWQNQPISSTSGPIGSTTGNHQMFSGSLLRTPLPRPSSPGKSSPNAFVSSPKISELHELPRPPAHLASSERPSNLIVHSAPLGLRAQEISSATTTRLAVSNTSSSTLPVPSQTVPRSYSIPSGSQREMPLHGGSKPSESPPQNLNKMVEDIASPPLTPISLSNS
ncbi:hypothetical protein LguiA_000029 [Lonicera macranthoides]